MEKAISTGNMGLYTGYNHCDNHAGNIALNANQHTVRVPHERDDDFNMDVAILDIIVVGMSARFITYDENINEYHVVLTDKQQTVLTLKGYKISRGYC